MSHYQSCIGAAFVPVDLRAGRALIEGQLSETKSYLAEDSAIFKLGTTLGDIEHPKMVRKRVIHRAFGC